MTERRSSVKFTHQLHYALLIRVLPTACSVIAWHTHPQRSDLANLECERASQRLPVTSVKRRERVGFRLGLKFRV
jgi:hypothetical protein